MVVALCIGIIKQAFIGLVRLAGWKKSNKAAGSSAAFPYIFVKAGMVLFYFLGSKVNQEKENGLISENNSWVKFKTRITIAFSISHLWLSVKQISNLGGRGSKSYDDGYAKTPFDFAKSNGHLKICRLIKSFKGTSKAKRRKIKKE